MASTVARMRSSLGGKKPTSGNEQQRRVEFARPVVLGEAARCRRRPSRRPLRESPGRRSTTASARARSPRSAASRAPRSAATQHMTFENVKCCGSPRTSQIPRSGSRQTRERHLDGLDHDAPGALAQRVARAGVLEDAVHNGAQDVELDLVVGGVADAHGSAPGVAREVVEFGLGRVASRRRRDRALGGWRAALWPLMTPPWGSSTSPRNARKSSASVSKPSACSARKRKGRVAHPGVAIVPVPAPAERLGQRRRRRREQRPGGGVGQTLQRQRAALEKLAPRVVGEAAAVDPVTPEAARLGATRVDLGPARRARARRSS